MNRTATLEAKKARLKNEIKLLEQLKNDTNNRLENVAEINENDINNYSFITSNSEDETSNSILKIKNELLILVGLRCIKSVKDECVFEFPAKDENNKQIKYFVQLLKANSGLSLGKWNFPMFIDVNDIWKEMPVIDIDTFCEFIKKCKHCIHCYQNRMNQFINFQNSLKQYANCTIDRDQTYRHIIIELLQVYNVKMDNYINVTVYLQYNFEEIRPFNIKVESQYDGLLPQETEKDIKPFFKPFKQFDLTDALETVEYKENLLFSWQRLTRDTTLIDNMDLDDIIPKRKRYSDKYRINKTKKRSLNSVSKSATKSKGNEVDIAKYFTRTESSAATKQKDLENSTDEQTEQDNSTRNSSPLKKKTKKLKRLKSNKNINLKNTKIMLKKDDSKNTVSTKNYDNKIIPEEKRILRPSSISPTKNMSPKKISPQKNGIFSKSSTINSSIINASSKKNSSKKLGRPLKKSLKTTINSPKKITSAMKNLSKKVGRPLKNPLKTTENSPKKNMSPIKISPKKVGRPLKNPLETTTNSPEKKASPIKLSPKKVGRPLKNPLETTTNSPEKKTSPIKLTPKKVGRPLKNPLETTTNSPEKKTSPTKLTPKKVGRPLKNSLKTTNSPTKNTSPMKISPKKVKSPLKKPLKTTKNSPKKNTSPMKISPKKLESPLRKPLKTTTNSPKKNTSPIEISPKKVGRPSKKTLPSDEIIKLKKLENLKKLVSSKTKVSPTISNVKFKQTNLQIPKFDKNISPTKMLTINLNTSDKVLRSKFITSTPHPEKNIKRLKQSLIDMNLSEIKDTKQRRVAKSPTKQTINKNSNEKKDK
ncbi:muscle M-line assembly protein unc-89-like [Leptopilina boulardi]|uniref:muscle M-line assembly protein unc-89-like n=1 Tax=Leptopilina boulardi TaxID=63433 RepID=UPI0021F5E3FB|nr:muscle M-line assembly protein unc-89-like [Leptopilina boulardi]